MPNYPTHRKQFDNALLTDKKASHTVQPTERGKGMRTLVIAIIVIIVLAWLFSSPDPIAVDVRDFFHSIYNDVFNH